MQHILVLELYRRCVFYRNLFFGTQKAMGRSAFFVHFVVFWYDCIFLKVFKTVSFGVEIKILPLQSILVLSCFITIIMAGTIGYNLKSMFLLVTLSHVLLVKCPLNSKGFHRFAKSSKLIQAIVIILSMFFTTENIINTQCP